MGLWCLLSSGSAELQQIKEKFKHDIEGVFINSAQGFVFITNQELRLSERKELNEVNSTIEMEIYHLERVASLLNSPKCYGTRMEFLDIEMSKEEQLAFFVDHNHALNATINRMELFYNLDKESLTNVKLETLRNEIRMVIIAKIERVADMHNLIKKRYHNYNTTTELKNTLEAYVDYGYSLMAEVFEAGTQELSPEEVEQRDRIFHETREVFSHYNSYYEQIEAGEKADPNGTK